MKLVLFLLAIVLAAYACSNDCDIGFFYDTDNKGCTSIFKDLEEVLLKDADYTIVNYNKQYLAVDGYYNGTHDWDFHFHVVDLGVKTGCALFCRDTEMNSQTCSEGESLEVITQVVDQIKIEQRANVTVHGCM